MDHDERTERFVQLLTDHQPRLFGYLVALLGDIHEARNVLQETNLVIWRRSADFTEGTDFGAWARSIAHYQVLAALRDRRRDRHLFFDESLLRQLADRHEMVAEEAEDRRHLALRECLAQLPDGMRLLISQRYAGGSSVRELARRLGKSEDAVKMSLSRIRQKLLQCIQRRVAAEVS